MAARGRRRRDANLGQIPLSSGEIELYSRQDEAARRRRRLLAVRDQERRLAQQVTQRYRQNLQRLQHGKSQKMHTQLNTEQRAQLTELHRRYQNSLQSMGTAQRNARAKLMELMEQAQHEQEKWNYNRQVTGKEREIEAQENREEEEAARNARRRQVEQNMQRLKLLSRQQRRQASDRARQEQELAMQRSKDREQLEQMIQRQSPEEVFVTPRPHRKDVVSYQFTRTHCVAPAVSTGKERPAVTVIKHNRKHPTARRGEDEANKYRDEVDQKRERDRLIAEEQKETAAERGKVAVDDVTSRQQGQQALEWLALVDKMERRGRGQELGGGDEYFLDVGEVDGVDDPQLMAERAFAQMLGLEEDSMELSAFSIETDDDESEGLADTDRELSGNVKPVKANAEYRVKLKAGKGSGSLDSLEEIESGRVGTKDRDGRAEAMYDNTEKPLKTTFFGDDERQELKKLKKAKYIQKDSSPSKGVLMETRSGVTVGEYEDNSGKTGERPFTNGGDDALPEASAVQWNTHRYSKAAAEGRRQNSYGGIEERPEGTDNEDDERHPPSHRPERENGSIERLENRLQEVLDFRMPRPRRDQLPTTRQPADDQESLFSGSESSHRASQLDEHDAGLLRRSGASASPRSGSNAAGNTRAVSLPANAEERGSPPLSFSATSEAVMPGEHRHMSTDDEESVASEGFPQTGFLNYSSSSGISEQHDDRRVSKDDFLHPRERGPGDHQELRVGGGDAFGTTPRINGEADIAGDSRLGYSPASSRSSYQSGRYDVDYHGHEAIETHPVNVSGVGPPKLQRNEIEKTARNKEVDGKAGQDHSGVGLWSSSAQERAIKPRDSRNLSATGRSEEMLAEHDENLSSSVSAASNDEFRQEPTTLGDKISRVVAVEEDSVSESSFAPSQKSIARLDQVAKNRERSLGQRFVDQHVLSFSSSEGLSDDERGAEGNLSRPPNGTGDAHPSVNINPHDPYRLQIDQQARRSSTSAISVAQYSLPPSDTQTSFDDSLDQLHPGYGEDSFVNELVPMFPKRALPHPFEEDSQAVEEYEVQLVAPNMSRMLTSDRRTSFGRSRQRLVHQDHQTDAAIDHTRRQPAARREEVGAGDRVPQIDQTEFSSLNRRSSAGSSNDEMDVESVETSVDEPQQQQQPGIKHTRRASTRPITAGSHQSRPAGMIDSNAVDNLSEISDSDSGVSSLGFAVQLNLVAGTTRRRKGGDGRREAPVRAASQQTKHADATTSADDLDNEDNVSDRSFASSSSMSMDAHFNYLSSMTSAVGKSLPLHLRLPAVIFGKKDMTKPPVPIAWSASSESSIASASELDPIEAVERGFAFDRSKTSRSNSSRSESLLEEQQCQRKMNWQVRGSDSSAGSHQSKALDESSYSESTDESEKAERVTFKDIKEKVAMLPPPPLGSLDMTQPPAPLKNLEHSFAGSLSSSEQSSEGFQSSERRQTRDHDRRPYEDEDERKSGGSSSGSDESSRSNDSSSSSFASSRRQSMKKAEKIVIPVKKTRSNNDGDSDGDEAGKEMSLAEAFKRRHPSFGHRVESHHDKLKRHRDQQHQQRQQEPEQKTPATRDTKKSEAAAPAADPLPPEQQELLDRLATGSRAKISSREMKERSRRLYHQLPEVVERKRQEEVMRRRRERLNELREQEKERRLQQKQRRQQQQDR